jgi:hypothetical protein
MYVKLPAKQWSVVPSPITESFRVSAAEAWESSIERKTSASDAM